MKNTHTQDLLHIRRYGTADVQRIVFIKSAQRLGFSLDEVADLLKLADSPHCDEARTLAEHKLEDVQHRIAELRRMEMALQELIGHCQINRNEANCPLTSALQVIRY
jgi:MerR family transcriptional regulator, mercuric resistance operon regulatory protein